MSSSRDPHPAVFAPGSASTSSGAYAPGRNDRLPAVDDRLVAPEAHAQILDGRVIRTMGSNPPHGMQHFEATGLFFGTLAEGYRGAVDMLTRLDEESDAAPDISVFPAAPDAKTGGRQLEEIAVEVLDAERMSHATDKVEKLSARGVRRIFAIRVASRTVYEWDHAHHDWTELPRDAVLTDRCFRVPVPAGALVDRLLADDAVAQALLASGNRVLQAALTRQREAGLEAGLRANARTSVLRVLALRGLTLGETGRDRLETCDELVLLQTWLDRAVTVATADDIFEA